MMNQDFFPTPQDVIRKLVAPYLYGAQPPIGTRTILEPSAGKGDILDYLRESSQRVDLSRMYCCEIEPELRLILQGKGYKVIEHDFLQYSDNHVFDLVLMNPPFSDGVDHLLKAWDILTSGDIACILNAESINNPYTEKRKLLKRLIEMHGSVEPIGQAFKTAERKTDVECVIIRLTKKPTSEGVKFEAGGFQFESAQVEAEFQANPLAHPNIIKALVSQYDHAVKLLIQMHSLDQQYEFYIKEVIDRWKDKPTTESLNTKITELKKKFWEYVFKKTKIAEVTTSKVRENFYKFIEQTAPLAFSEVNIMSVFEMIFENREEIMQQCIDSVFEAATRYHDKNVIHTEGWKHNKSWKINKKIIIPNATSYWSKADDFFDDLDKAMCFVAGVKFERLQYRYAHEAPQRSAVPSIREAMERKYWLSGHENDVYESYFFTIRSYKKGTVHLTFKDMNLLAQLNLAASQGKREVGGGY